MPLRTKVRNGLNSENPKDRSGRRPLVLAGSESAIIMLGPDGIRGQEKRLRSQPPRGDHSGEWFGDAASMMQITDGFDSGRKENCYDSGH